MDFSLRERWITYAESYLHTPYELGGQTGEIIDCSGLIVECDRMAGYVPESYDATADMLYYSDRMVEVDYPYRGCLCFWGREVEDGRNTNLHITHVEISLGENGRQILCLGARPGYGVVQRPWSKFRGTSVHAGFRDPHRIKY